MTFMGRLLEGCLCSKKKKTTKKNNANFNFAKEHMDKPGSLGSELPSLEESQL